VTREEWVEQAKELLAGKPPRAKVDQAAQKASED
jgi:large subunit ribosomal protein L21